MQYPALVNGATPSLVRRLTHIARARQAPPRNKTPYPATAADGTPRTMQIFRAGTHTDSRGRTLTFSAADIAATAAAYAPDVHEAPLVVGHPAMDDPAYGWVESLHATGDGVLEATPHQVDPAFAEMVAEGRFKRVSASFYAPDAATNPAPGVWYLRHVGFLGAHPPAVKGLRPVQFSAGADGLVTIEFASALSTPTEGTMTTTDTTDSASKALLAEIADVRARLEADRAALRAERAAFDAECAAFSETVAAAAAQKRRDTAQSIVEACVKAGQIVPKGRQQLVEFMTWLDDAETVSFGEDEADRKTPAAWFASWLQSLPGTIRYGEVAGGAAAVAARAGAAIDPVATANLARRKMAAETFGGALDPRDAVAAVLRGE
ncbi:conserved hypothetical protein [Candidatus Defluviicoccus seviourii]|uniref:Peptidase n=1 Tax=Candidatus Defluviicoccus seviourii TaxID=2565273 RepID=A0A564WHC2_9PROT|nr:conserved hypothetical protein [Candidatus Defluviicoccus seviourii]